MIKGLFEYLYHVGLRPVGSAQSQTAGIRKMPCTLAHTLLQLSWFCGELLKFNQSNLFLLLLSVSSKLESRNQEVHQEVGVDTEMVRSSLTLNIYLEGVVV